MENLLLDGACGLNTFTSKMHVGERFSRLFLPECLHARTPSSVIADAYLRVCPSRGCNLYISVSKVF